MCALGGKPAAPEKRGRFPGDVAPDEAGNRELERGLSAWTIFLRVLLAAWREPADGRNALPVTVTKGQAGEEVGDAGKGQVGKVGPGFQVEG